MGTEGPFLERGWGWGAFKNANQVDAGKEEDTHVIWRCVGLSIRFRLETYRIESIKAEIACAISLGKMRDTGTEHMQSDGLTGTDMP